MAAVADIVDDVIGIDEICYRAHRTRGQLAIWRGQPDFPEPQKTKYGLIGYSWREVVNWMVGNQHWIRHRAHHPSLDELVASVKTSPPRPTLDDGAQSPLPRVQPAKCTHAERPLCNKGDPFAGKQQHELERTGCTRSIDTSGV